MQLVCLILISLFPHRMMTNQWLTSWTNWALWSWRTSPASPSLMLWVGDFPLKTGQVFCVWTRSDENDCWGQTKIGFTAVYFTWIAFTTFLNERIRCDLTSTKRSTNCIMRASFSFWPRNKNNTEWTAAAEQPLTFSFFFFHVIIRLSWQWKYKFRDFFLRN